MDWYFVICIAVFFIIGIVMVFFAFQGPRCIDYDESHYEEILGQEQKLLQENLNLTMPLPDNGDEDDIAPAISLTSPYPQKPPPLGFGRILAERNSEGLDPYPQSEDVGRMSHPAPIGSFPYVDPPSNFTRKIPLQPNEMLYFTRGTHTPTASTQTQTNGACIRKNEPPPPYSEAIAQPIRTRRKRFQKRLSQ